MDYIAVIESLQSDIAVGWMYSVENKKKIRQK